MGGLMYNGNSSGNAKVDNVGSGNNRHNYKVYVIEFTSMLPATEIQVCE